MAQESVAQIRSGDLHGDKAAHGKHLLGPLLCWAVVFADIGTSIYYVPGILYQTVQSLAGFFVSLTLLVFILLTLKYTEVTHRFPQGGGVVTVAAQAINPWFGALGGMFILVDYFLTAAISSLSGMQYLSVVILPLGAMVALPGLGQIQLLILAITIGVLVLLGILNWIGISESAKVSLVGALIAFFSDIAILFTIFTHISLADFLALMPKMFASHALTPFSFLAGFAGSFLAFSGLESISQLSPVMKQPHKKVAGIAMLLVVITIGVTSPLLTMLSTLLLPDAAKDSVLSGQIISLIAGKYGGILLQTEVAISASALLIFVSNTAIIGAYHVFMALSRMGFLPGSVLKRNKLRCSPHYAIALATGIPILVLVAVAGNINILGDMYAFGLLGAFTLTCLGLDIVRYRDWKKAREARTNGTLQTNGANNHAYLGNGQQKDLDALTVFQATDTDSVQSVSMHGTSMENTLAGQEAKGLWFKIDFFLGVLTTALVAVAWSTNLVSKPLATAFGGGVAVVGMVIAYRNYTRAETESYVPVPVVVTRIEGRKPDSVLAVLMPDNPHNSAVIRAAVQTSEATKPVIFLYLRKHTRRPEVPRLMEIVDPYLEDQEAKQTFGRAESMALHAKVPERKYVYIQDGPDIVTHVWQVLHPRDTVVAAEENEQFKDINPDRIRYELTPDGKVAHLLKRW